VKKQTLKKKHSGSHLVKEQKVKRGGDYQQIHRKRAIKEETTKKRGERKINNNT